MITKAYYPTTSGKHRADVTWAIIKNTVYNME